MIDYKLTPRRGLSRHNNTGGYHIRKTAILNPVDADKSSLATPLEGIAVFAGFMLALFVVVSWLL